MFAAMIPAWTIGVARPRRRPWAPTRRCLTGSTRFRLRARSWPSLLPGWDVADPVIDDASLVATERMSNSAEHGLGVAHLGIAVHRGLLRVGV